MFRRIDRRSRPPTPVMSLPANLTRPEAMGTLPRMALPVVVLPEPDSPTSPNVSPRSIEKLMSSTAVRRVWRWPQRPSRPTL